jgi:hypothetical protein
MVLVLFLSAACGKQPAPDGVRSGILVLRCAFDDPSGPKRVDLELDLTNNTARRLPTNLPPHVSLHLPTDSRGVVHVSRDDYLITFQDARSLMWVFKVNRSSGESGLDFSTAGIRSVRMQQGIEPPFEPGSCLSASP